MILTSTDDLKNYISVSKSFEFLDFKLYITKAINTYTYKYVGNLHEFLKDKDEVLSPKAIIRNTAREYLRSAIANFGYFLFTPYTSVQMSASGMSNIVSEQRKSIDMFQLNDIRRELLRSGHESMDLLLTQLESNPLVFKDWTANYGTINKELLVHNTAIFQKYYNIFNSRQTFLALIPSVRQIEDQYIYTMLCPELVKHLKIEKKFTPNEIFLKEYLQKAIVSFTIAKVYDEGLFEITASGVRLKFDTLPYEQSRIIDYGKGADLMAKTVIKLINNGTQYLQMAKDIIIENLVEFNQCDNPIILSKTGTGSGFQPYNTKGVVGL